MVFQTYSNNHDNGLTEDVIKTIQSQLLKTRKFYKAICVTNFLRDDECFELFYKPVNAYTEEYYIFMGKGFYREVKKNCQINVEKSFLDISGIPVVFDDNLYFELCIRKS